jgi:hypothetical protein
MKIQSVNTDLISQVWPKVEEFLDAALRSVPDYDASSENYSLEHIKVFLTQGRWQLVVASSDDGTIHGAATIEYINHPNARVAFLTCMGGKGIISAENYPKLMNLLRSHGATKIECVTAKRAVARLWTRFGLNEKYRLLEASI